MSIQSGPIRPQKPLKMYFKSMHLVNILTINLVTAADGYMGVFTNDVMTLQGWGWGDGKICISDYLSILCDLYIFV